MVTSQPSARGGRFTAKLKMLLVEAASAVF
jgi:hypothetical protein